MKKNLLIFTILLFAILIIFTFIKHISYNTQRVATVFQKKTVQKPLVTNMKITSTVFENNANIPRKYTCDGDNINPPLSFFEVPDNAKSLVLIVDDPDAPVGIFVHWVVYNIDPKTSDVFENNVPAKGQSGISGFGKPGYGGPCPPSGTHRYFFKLYALDTMLDKLNNPDKKIVENAMQGHIITHAELIGLYSRQK